MKKLLIPAVFASLLFASCGDNAAPPMDESAVQAKADSTVGARLDELNMQATEDLDRRVAIEVKPKADSIIEARKANK